MVDNNNQYIPMVHIVDRNKRRERLASRLEVCADRICDLQDRLMAGITALRPIEYDRLRRIPSGAGALRQHRPGTPAIGGPYENRRVQGLLPQCQQAAEK